MTDILVGGAVATVGLLAAADFRGWVSRFVRRLTPDEPPLRRLSRRRRYDPEREAQKVARRWRVGLGVFGAVGLLVVLATVRSLVF